MAADRLHVLYLIDSLGTGGAEQSLAAVAPGLLRAGIDLDVAYLVERPGVHVDLQRAGIPLHCLQGRGGRLGAWLRLRRLLRRTGPDLVHTTLFEANVLGRVAAKTCGIPVVSSLVNTPYGSTHLQDQSLRRWKVGTARRLDAMTGRWVRRFHAVAATVADEMAARLDVPRSRIEVIHRGRDAEALGPCTQARRSATRVELGVADTAPVVVALARHEFQKGLDVLIDAAALLRTEQPGLRVLIAGKEGAATPALRHQISFSGLEDVVSLLGHRDDVGDLLCSADVFALPSRREGLPGVVLEAMSVGTPVVATSLPGVVEALGTDAALFVVPDDPLALANALVESLRQPASSSRRAQLARERFSAGFGIDRAAAELAGFYRRALGRGDEQVSVEATEP